MTSLEKLYEVGSVLSAVEKSGKFENLSSEYKTVLLGVKSTDPHAKRLASQFIARFFSHFPAEAAEALEAMLDLCEDEDVNIRKQAIKDLPSLCRELKEYLPKIVDVLAQLLQSDDAKETLVIQSSLMSLFRKDAKGTLIGLFSQIKTGGDIVRERSLGFLSAKVKAEGKNLLNKEAEFTLLKEVKASLTDCTADEFHQFMQMLNTTSIPKSLTGQTQLLEIVASMAELDKPFDAMDPEAVDKLVQCSEAAVEYFSPQVKSTKFCEFLCHQVLPQLHSVADLDDQTKLLKILGETCMFTSDLEDALKATKNIYQKLIDYMPLPPMDAAALVESSNTTDPEFEFTKVECLLLAYHTVGRQAPQHLTEDPERDKDFKARLQYFSRGNQAYIKKLNEYLAKKTPVELLQEDNKTKAMALKCTSNIQTLIKDLCRVTPIYKARVVVSWKPDLAKKVSKTVSSSTAAVSTISPGSKRQAITFNGGDGGKRQRKSESNGGGYRGGQRGARPVASGDGAGLYKPPTGKYSTGLDEYKESGSYRGRGGWRRGRGEGFRGRRYSMY